MLYWSSSSVCDGKHFVLKIHKLLFHFKVYVELPTFPPYHNCNIYLELKWQMFGSPVYDGQIRVIYVDYLLLSCMPVYMLLYVCYMHMIPSFHNKWHFHIKLVFWVSPIKLSTCCVDKSVISFAWQQCTLQILWYTQGAIGVADYQ